MVIEGVPASGVIDSGAEITIINGKLFARIAAVAHLKKSRLKPPDRIPKTYDRWAFALDGRMDLDVTFDGVTMRTPIYIKIDAADQLLLGEGICRQLKMITYHPSLSSKKNQRGNQGVKTQRTPETRAVSGTKDRKATEEAGDSNCRSKGPTIPERVGTIRVCKESRRHHKGVA